MGIAAEMTARQQSSAAPVESQNTGSEDASASPAENSGVEHPDFPPRAAPSPSAKDTAPAQQSEPPEPNHVPYAAMKAEREKRQKIEAEHQRALGELEALRRMQQPAKQDKPSEPSKSELEAQMWGDPIGFQDQRIKTFWEQQRAQEWQERLADDVADMRDEHEDYDQMETVFAEMANKDPSLWRRIRREAHPAEWAYNRAKKFAEKQAAGGAKEKELLAKVAELEEKLKGSEAVASAAQVPQSNAGSRGAGISAAEPRPPTGSRAALYGKNPRKSY